MALIEMVDYEEDHRPVVEETHGSSIFGKNFIFNPDTNDWEWNGTTYVFRINKPRANMSSISNAFNNRIRAVAEIWHNVLNDNERQFWKDANSGQEVSRPGMKGLEHHGWWLFACYALAIVGAQVAPPFTWPVAEGAMLDDVVISNANADSQLVTFIRSPAGEPTARGFLMVHQVDPKHIGRRDASRRTLMTGYFSLDTANKDVTVFVLPAVFHFNAGDTVSFLIREHVTAWGAVNRIRNCFAT